MTSASLASNASGSASATAATRLIQRIWTGSIGSSSRRVCGSNGKNNTA